MSRTPGLHPGCLGSIPEQRIKILLQAITHCCLSEIKTSSGLEIFPLSPLMTRTYYLPESLFFLFWPQPWQVEVLGPGTELTPQWWLQYNMGPLTHCATRELHGSPSYLCSHGYISRSLNILKHPLNTERPTCFLICKYIPQEWNIWQLRYEVIV